MSFCLDCGEFWGDDSFIKRCPKCAKKYKGAEVKQVICVSCGRGTDIFRHDKHIIHKVGLVCYDCQLNYEKLSANEVKQ